MNFLYNTFHNIGVGLAKVIAVGLISVLSTAGYQIPVQQIPTQVPTQVSQETPLLGNYNPSGGGTYRLQTSIGTTDTSVRLSSFKEPISNIPYTMTYLNSSIGYGTLDPQSNRSEFISFTGITQNSNGTAILTGVSRGMARSYPYTASTTLRQAHAGQSIFILSDSPQHFAEYGVKANNETITGDWHAPFPATDSSLVIRSYVDGKAFSGIGGASETATGTVEIATGIEAASSTTNGSLGRLVLPSSMSTSTCATNDSACALKVVVTQNNGKIDPNRIATSTLFAGPINLAPTGTSTLATTTINGYNPWGLIASTTATILSTSMSVNNIAPRNNLRVEIMASTTLAPDSGSMVITFNNDSGLHYSTTTTAAIAFWNPSNGTLNNDRFNAYLTFNMLAASSTFKTVHGLFEAYVPGGTGFPEPTYNTTSRMVWLNSTSSVSSIQVNLISVAGTLRFTGGFIKVYGDTSNP